MSLKMFQNSYAPLGFKMNEEKVNTQMAIKGHKNPVVGIIDLVL